MEVEVKSSRGQQEGNMEKGMGSRGVVLRVQCELTEQGPAAELRTVNVHRGKEKKRQRCIFSCFV